MNLKDKIFVSSWGYSMSLNDYVKVIEDEGKPTVKVISIKSRIEGDPGYMFPLPEEEVGQPFRLKRKGFATEIYLKGSYIMVPEIAVGHSSSKRMGLFTEYKGQGNYYNTWD